MSDRTPRNGNTVSKTIRDDFARSLKTQIQRSGTKQGDLARKVGMSEQAMSTVLNGHSFPTRYLDRICEELGVRVVLYADSELVSLKLIEYDYLVMKKRSDELLVALKKCKEYAQLNRSNHEIIMISDEAINKIASDETPPQP